jgi:hypothetical protein
MKTNIYQLKWNNYISRKIYGSVTSFAREVKESNITGSERDGIQFKVNGKIKKWGDSELFMEYLECYRSAKINIHN